MKKIIFALGILLVSVNVLAQTLNINEPLPVNQRIKKGVLPNGMTYYIYKTDVVKNAASYYIIQNVGSILENDDQQGLAHFLEHMAFNGTKHFEGKGVLNILQKHGAVFGKDINAYTSFDETVYNMDNIPTSDGLIDTSLLILHDWANDLLLTDEEIDAERGVIKEEWRTRQSGGMRILKKSLPTMFNHTKYAERMPIGLMDIVDNFEYKALRDFYHDWYRTDLQAIAIVGDIDVDEIEQKIKELFSEIPAVENPKERYIVGIPDNQEMLYNLGMDTEVATSSISFSINRSKSLKDETVVDLEDGLLNGLVTSMLSSRLREVSQKPEASFIRASSSFGSLSRSTNNFGLRITPKPNQQNEAFRDAMTELNRAVKFGFTQAEIDRTIVMFSNYYETQISKIEDIRHSQIISTIKKNYLENETMLDIPKEYELAKIMFAKFDVASLHNHIKKLYTAQNRVLNVTGVEGNNNLTKVKALQIIKEVESDSELIAYTDSFSGKTLISGLTINKGSIISEVVNKEIGSTTFVLSNGVTVHYKFTDKQKNNVQFEATSWGGTSLLNDEDLPSASMVGDLIQMSGIGDYKSTDLRKVLAGKTASANISIGGLSESVSGSSITKDVETMLQLTYLRFVKPRFDEDSYKVLLNSLENSKIRKSKNIGSKMQDSITVTLYGTDNPKKRLFDDAYTDDISFVKIKEIYLDRFNDASDFEFFIIGDVKAEALKPLLEKYIASIPTKDTKEMWEDNSVSWDNDKTDKDIYLKMEDPKGSVRIAFKNEMDFSLENQYLARTLKDILQLRLTETLREQEGGTYGAGVYSSLNRRPKEEVSVAVSFDCNPDKVEKLVAIVYQEIDKIKSGEIQQVDLDKTLTNYLKELEEAKDKNSYELNLIYAYFIDGYNKNDPKNSVDIVNKITAADIQDFTKRLMENTKSYEIVFKPEK